MINWPPGPFKQKKETAEPLHPPLSAERLAGIKSYEKPAESLLESLEPSIEDGSIGALIGIDAAGRLPTQMLGTMLEKLYEKRGFAPPAQAFLAIGQDDSGKYGTRDKTGEAAFQAAISNIASGLDRAKKVLIVDDTLDSGKSVESIARPLVALGFQVEIVAFGSFTMKETFTLRKETPLSDAERAEIDTLKERAEQEFKADGYGPGSQAAQDEAEAAVQRALYVALPLHVGTYGYEMPKLYPGTSRMAGVPHLPPSVIPPGVTAAADMLSAIGEGIVARYEAKKEKAPA